MFEFIFLFFNGGDRHESHNHKTAAIWRLKQAVERQEKADEC